MRFSIRHLLAFVTLFALSLASGLPGSRMVPDGHWEITSLHEEENGAMWHGADTDTGEPWGGVGMDYIVTIRDGIRSKQVILGDTNIVWDHQLPSVGEYVVLKESKTDTHGTLPVTVVDELPIHTVVLSVVASILLSTFLVCAGVGVHRLVNRFNVNPTNS
ncbi:MAG: hypothetical protein AAF802_30290 [Planctomycetota bacterium]